MVESFESERSAYEALHTLQGTFLPRLLLTGLIDFSDSRAIHPPAVVLEYISGVTLRDIEPNLLSLDVCAPLVSCIDSFVEFGVFHGDINPGNIIFQPAERPVRAVVLDFGCAGVKVEGEDEDTWLFTVNFLGDSTRIRTYLREKGIHIPDLPEPDLSHMN
ncbi:hypothetical protein HGRIS_000517 [Hohenbuehelia grisea]